MTLMDTALSEYDWLSDFRGKTPEEKLKAF